MDKVMWIKDFSTGTRILISEQRNSPIEKNEFLRLTKQKFEDYIKINFLPINNQLVCLAENENYTFHLDNSFPILGIDVLQISIGSTSNDISVTFSNGKPYWKKGQDNCSDTVLISTSKSYGYSHLYFSLTYKINSNFCFIICGMSIMACISEDDAKPFLLEGLPIDTIQSTPFKPTLCNFKDNIPASHDFVSVIASPLTDQEKKDLQNWTGWNIQQIKQYSVQQQRQYYNKYKNNRGYYGYQISEPMIKADSVKVTLIEQDRPRFVSYSSGIGTSYAVFQSNIQINTVFYKTDENPVQYSAEKNLQNVKVFYYLKNKSNFDSYSLAKDIALSNELSVISEVFPNGLNVYWKPIEQAVHYYVEAFKAYDVYSYRSNNDVLAIENTVLFDTDQRKMIYFKDNKAFNLSQIRYMFKERVDREKSFFAQPYLAPGNYLIRVSAENRNGDVIAKSYAVLVSIYNQVR